MTQNKMFPEEMIQKMKMTIKNVLRQNRLSLSGMCNVRTAKKTLLTAAIAFVAVSANAQRIKGSDTCLPLSQQEAENYMKTVPSASVTVTGGGSGVGIAALLEGTTDIAQLSRKIKFDERQKL